MHVIPTIDAPWWPIHDVTHGDAIALVALALAVLHSYNLFKHGRTLSAAQKRLDKVTVDLTKVLETLPTHPLYEFPSYMSDIADLVAKAKRHILVCCDQPAYGSFSARESFAKYAAAVQQHMQDGKHISLRCLNQHERRENTKVQFSRFQPQEKWNLFKKDKETELRAYLRTHDYYQRHHPEIAVPDFDHIQYEDFIDLLVAENTLTLDSVFEATDAKSEMKKKPPLYFWYVDDTMIFVVSSDDRRTENGFYTRDRDLIRSFLHLTEDYTHFRAEGVLDTVQRLAESSTELAGKR